MVANHKPKKIFLTSPEPFLPQVHLIGADHIHFGVELEAGDAITQVDEARAGIAANYFLSLAQSSQVYGFRRNWRGQIISLAQIEEKCLPVSLVIEGGFARSQQLPDDGRNLAAFFSRRPA